MNVFIERERSTEMDRKPTNSEYFDAMMLANRILFYVDQGTLNYESTMDDLRSILDGRSGSKNLINGMFIPPEAQLENVKRWNNLYKWGFTEEDFIKLGAPPKWPHDKLTAVVLVAYLETVEDTFVEWWSLAAKHQKTHRELIKLDSDEYKILLLCKPFIKHEVKWEVIDLGSSWDKRKNLAPEDVKERPLPNAGILAALAHFPKWVEKMDGDSIPFVWLSGYRLRNLKMEGRIEVPYVSFSDSSNKINNSGISLSSCVTGYASGSVAVPIFVDNGIESLNGQ